MKGNLNVGDVSEGIVKLHSAIAQWEMHDYDIVSDLIRYNYKMHGASAIVSMHLDSEMNCMPLVLAWKAASGDVSWSVKMCLDTWDGALPPVFVEFMDEHFKREEGR